MPLPMGHSLVLFEEENYLLARYELVKEVRILQVFVRPRAIHIAVSVLRGLEGTWNKYKTGLPGQRSMAGEMTFLIRYQTLSI